MNQNCVKYWVIFRSVQIIFAYTFPKLVFPVVSTLVFPTQLAFDLLIAVRHFLACTNSKNNVLSLRARDAPSESWQCHFDVIDIACRLTSEGCCLMSSKRLVCSQSFLSICVYFNLSIGGFWTRDCHQCGPWLKIRLGHLDLLILVFNFQGEESICIVQRAHLCTQVVAAGLDPGTFWFLSASR